MDVFNLEIRVRQKALERHGGVGRQWLWQVRTEPGDNKFAWQDIAEVTDYGNGYFHIHGYNVSSSDREKNVLFLKAMGQVYPAAVAKYEQLIAEKEYADENKNGT